MSKNGAESEMKTILSRLKKRYPEETATSLDSGTPWQLLAATMLSAQAQDVQVNKATPALFNRYPDPKSTAKLRPTQLYPYIRTLGYYKTKAKHMVGAAKYIMEHFNGRVPETMDQLVQLPGVGRKTANVVLSNAFGANYGIAIDTHCITVSNRLFLYGTNDAAKIERRLMDVVPRNDWKNVSHLFIALGRDVCTARRKYCSDCVLKDICPSSDAP